VGNTPEQFAEQIKAEFSVYKVVAAKAHARLSTALSKAAGRPARLFHGAYCGRAIVFDA
jgi:hypothetical protein